MEVEQALVEAEMDSEVAGLQQEKDAMEAVHDKMTDLETKSQQEKEKVNSQLHFTVEGGRNGMFVWRSGGLDARRVMKALKGWK